MREKGKEGFRPHYHVARARLLRILQKKNMSPKDANPNFYDQNQASIDPFPYYGAKSYLYSLSFVSTGRIPVGVSGIDAIVVSFVGIRPSCFWRGDNYEKGNCNEKDQYKRIIVGTLGA